MTKVANQASSPSWILKWFGWLDSDYMSRNIKVQRAEQKTDHWSRYLPFAFLHLGVLGVIWAGWSWFAVIVAVVLYWSRVFFVTAFYHRYFSHRTFKTNRFFQFLFGLLGITCVQRGPLWWAAHHRHHHQYSDQVEDIHSPVQTGFWWSHIGWIACPSNMPTDYDRIKDFAKYPELVFLNRFDWIGSALVIFLMIGLGYFCQAYYPSLNTSPLQLVVWGYFVSTVFLFHATCAINSIAHVWGKQRYATGDTSQNNLLLALVTLGEGWHNNHHYCCSTVRQGFYWWEVDISYYILVVLSWLGIVYDLKPVPDYAYQDKVQIPVEQRKWIFFPGGAKKLLVRH